MTVSRHVLLAAVFYFCLPAVSLRAAEASSSVSVLRAGQVSPVMVVADREFLFDDPAFAASQRRQRVARVPLVVRRDAAVADAAVAALRKDFTANRDRFLAALQRVAERNDAEPSALPAAEWRAFLAEQMADSSGFPLDAALASAWAAGGGAEEVLDRWCARLRDGMLPLRIRADELPAVEGGFPASALLVEAGRAEPDVAAGEPLLLSQLLPPAQARARFVSSFTGGTPALARHLAGFLRPDCAPDVAATLRLRVAAAMGGDAPETIQRGQVLVRAGEVVTPRAAAMVEALRRGETPAAPDGGRPLVMAVSALSGVVIFGLWWLVGRRRRAGVSEAVVIVDDEPLSPAGALPPSREELLALLREEFVGTLVEQRRTMLDAQQQAGAELARIERRLTELQAPLQCRLDAYEQRITELEAELHRQGDENRELLQTTIELMQQKVREAKAGGRVTLN